MKTYMIMLDDGISNVIQEFKANNPDDGLGAASDYFRTLFPDLDWNTIPLKIVKVS